MDKGKNEGKGVPRRLSQALCTHYVLFITSAKDECLLQRKVTG